MDASRRQSPTEQTADTLTHWWLYRERREGGQLMNTSTAASRGISSIPQILHTVASDKTTQTSHSS